MTKYTIPHELLEYGRILHGRFKVLCIRKCRIDTGFETVYFRPMISYNAKRMGNYIAVSATPADNTEKNDPFAGMYWFKINDKRTSEKIKRFAKYFRML